MSQVMVRYLKYPTSLHWHFRLERIGEDDHGVWLGGSPGTVIRRGTDEPKVTDRHFVVLVPRGRWWTITWTKVDGGADMYVDINTPPGWDGDTVEMIDLDLDVVRRSGGPIEVWDEDEFAEHSIQLGYPPQLIARARTTTAEVVLAAEAGQEPFASAHEPWMRSIVDAEA